MLKPIALLHPFGERRECAAFEIRPNKIDLDEPSGVVECRDRYTSAVLPVAVALRRVPPLNACECRFHRVRSTHPADPSERPERFGWDERRRPTAGTADD